MINTQPYPYMEKWIQLLPSFYKCLPCLCCDRKRSTQWIGRQTGSTKSWSRCSDKFNSKWIKCFDTFCRTTFPLLLVLTFCLSPVYGLTNSTTPTKGDSIITITGLLGDKVSIPCTINTDDCGEVYFVAWTKNTVLDENSETWSRVYMYSENINKPLRELSSRAAFQVEPSKGGNLVIDKLKYSDEAYYKCDVTYISVGKCPSLTYIHLEILAAPSKASIEITGSPNSIPNSGKIVDGSNSIGPFREGDEVHLTCKVTGGKPEPSLEWWSVKGDNKLVLSSSSSSSSSSSTSPSSDNSTSLALIKKIERSDLNSKLQCHVKHESIEPDNYQYDSTVDLDINVGALSVYIVGPIEEVKENDLITIKCIAIGSRPHVNIEWFNGTQPMQNVKLSEEIYEDKESGDGTKRTESIMELYITRFDHLTTIECRAINSAMNEPLKATIQFKVLYSPTIVMEPENGLKLQENQESINIYCTYNANPVELKRNETRWFKDSQEIDIEGSEGRYLSIFSGYPILSIINVTRDHSATYYCSIANEIGSSKAKQGVHLNIIYRPTVTFRIFPDVRSGIMIKEGDDIQLLCDVEDGNPSNVSKVRWIRTTSEGSDTIINETSQNEIVWLSVDRSLSGNYSCQALNEAGWSKESNMVELDVKYLPSQAQIQQINGNYPVKGEPLILECIVHQLGWPIAEEYLWEQDGIRLIDSTESILNITNVTLSTRGNYSCAAISMAGLGSKGYLYIQPMVPPKMIESLPEVDGALFNASQHSVSCRVECDPPCSIKWYSNGSIIEPNSSTSYTIKETQHPEEKESNIFLSIVSTLTWNMAQPLNRETGNSEITCSSTNNLAGPGVESNMQFRVEYPPENIFVSPQTVTVVEGNIPEAIKCHSDALPEASYRWERWGVPIVVSPILEIHNPMNQETGGNYSCVAYNRHGSTRVDAVINVLHKPVCEISESEVRGSEADGPSSIYVVLICEAIANPSDNLSFQWTLGNSTFTSTNSSDIVTNQGLRSQIVISPNDESMFGTWTCSVTNSVGSSSCLFTKSAPLIDSRWTMPHFDEKSIILIAGILAIIIIIFIIILIIMFCRMKRRRAKQESHSLASDREKPESERTPTPSSYISHVPSNKGFLPLNVDIIPSNGGSQSQLESTPKPENEIDNSSINPNTKEMYENMPFHRRELGSIKYGPLEQNIVYADLQLTYDENDLVNNKGYQMNTNLITGSDLHRKNSTLLTASKHPKSHQFNNSTLNSYHNQQLQLNNHIVDSLSNTDYVSKLITKQQQRQLNLNSFNKSLTAATATPSPPAANHSHHQLSSPFNINQAISYPYTQNQYTSLTPSILNNHRHQHQQHLTSPHHYHQPTNELSSPSHQIHYASSRISDYAVLRFDKTPSPPSIC
ncbi:hemicentin-2 isoform X3 [Tetranychus urticae]|uniref:Ig-like domain-containing protein n=1 Tax=Tetranychus urticae TaxID=32264 RepID=T1L3Z1_TETUR|nr:hemicentin-2 isoform X3 [Tetranychus urticae]